MRAAKVIVGLLKILVVIQIVFGLAFWMGRAINFIPLHEGLGTLFVVLLWALAAIGAVRGAGAGLVTLAVVWGCIVAALGYTQQRLLIGDLHWIVRVLHLIVGLSSIRIAELLAAKMGATVRPS
jgi:hypothetical protein